MIQEGCPPLSFFLFACGYHYKKIWSLRWQSCLILVWIQKAPWSDYLHLDLIIYASISAGPSLALVRKLLNAGNILPDKGVQACLRLLIHALINLIFLGGWSWYRQSLWAIQPSSTACASFPGRLGIYLCHSSGSIPGLGRSQEKG